MHRWLACLVVVPSIAHAEESSIPSVMDKRWSAAMGYGVAIARPRTEDADAVLLFDGQFSLHFRVVPELQIGLALGGGFSVAGVDDREGYGGIFIDARYSFAVERAWHPMLTGGIGYARGTFARGGIGLERRFVSWAFSLEAHLTRTGGNDDALDELERFGVWSVGTDLAARYHWGGGTKRRRFVP